MSGYCGAGATRLLDSDDKVDASGETFAHNDGSWPCLKGINLTGINDSTLHYVVPSGYFDRGRSDASFNMSLQNIAMEDRTVETDSIQGFPTYTLFNGGNISGARYRFFLAEQSASYTSAYPQKQADPDRGLGSTCYQVDSCADTDFAPPTLTAWPQFAFTTTVPASLYKDQLQLNRGIATGSNDDSCALDVPVSCANLSSTSPGEESMAYNAGGCLTQTLASNSGDGAPEAFGKNRCLCLNSATAGLDVKFCEDGGGQQECTTSNNAVSGEANNDMAAQGSVPHTSVSANFRDGYQRLQAENIAAMTDGTPLMPTYLTEDVDTACWGQGNDDTVWFQASYTDAGQLYSGYIRPLDDLQIGRGTENDSAPYNVPDQVIFTSPGTCAPPPEELADQNALIMMDVDRYDTAYPVRRVFANLEWVGSSTDPKPLFAQSNGAYVQSFNVVARMPTCLASEDAQPTTATAGFNEDFRSISCYATDQSYNPWAWTKPVNLGYAAGDYTGGETGAWNEPLYPNWPSVETPVTDGFPDIVVRLAFANTYLVDPAAGIPTNLQIDNPDFENNLVAIWGQNKPGAALTLTSPITDSLLSADMRAVALYEYAAAVLYRGLFASYVTMSDVTNTPTNRWYSVGSNLIKTGTYKPYDAAEYLTDYFTAFLPSFGTYVQDTGTVQDELARQSQDLISNASDYFRYPRLRYDPESQTLWVDFYCDLYTHLNLLNAQGGSVQQYLRNMYQDSGLASIQSGTATLMTPGSTSTAPDIVLSNAATHDPSGNLVWTGTDSDDPITFTTSYYWTQEISSLSPVSMIWLGIMGASTARPTWLDWYETIGWNTLSLWAPTGVPQLIAPTEVDAASEGDAGVYATCLETKPLTLACAEKLCPASKCLCDYSLTLDSVTINPASAVYFNNSNQACSCLANASYPIGADGNLRAWNPATLCFSQACQDYGFDEHGVDCSSTGCASFSEAVDLANRSVSDGTWTQAFGALGAGLNVESIRSTCGLDVRVEEATDQQPFFINGWALAAALCLTLTVPASLTLDYSLRRQIYSKLFYALSAAIWVCCLLASIMITYGLSGVRTCVDPDTQLPTYRYDNVAQGRCVDRLTGQVSLTPDACNQAPPAFCQCADAETVCDGYFGGAATCSANHMCCVCENSCFTSEIQTGTTSLDKTQVSSSILALGICVFLLLAACICATLPTLLGRTSRFWDGHKYTVQKGRHLTVQLLITGLLIAGCGIGIGLGIYYGSQVVPVTVRQINRALQETDLSANIACSSLV